MRRSVIYLIAITLAAAVFYGTRYVKTPVETRVATITTHEDYISTEAYLVRSEAVYTAAAAGTYYSYAAEGSRVGKDRLISTVYDGFVNSEILQELSNVDAKIRQLESSAEKSTLFRSDNSSGQAAIENAKNSIISAAIDRDIAKITEAKNTIININSGNTTDNTGALTELQATRTRLEARLTGTKHDIYSSMSGIFSSSTDGFESILTPEAIMSYKTADFYALSVPDDTAAAKSSVSSGEAVCKVVDNHSWYIMAPVSSQRASELHIGSRVTLRFDKLPGAEVSAELVSASEEEADADTVLLIFKSDRYLEGAYSIRKSKADIVLESYTGFEVPVYSIRVSDGKNGVMVKNGVSEVFKECDIIYTNPETETVIITPAENAKNRLEIMDKIVIGEKSADALTGYSGTSDTAEDAENQADTSENEVEQQ